MADSFIERETQVTVQKKSLNNFIIYGCIEHSSPREGMEHTTFNNDCTGISVNDDTELFLKNGDNAIIFLYRYIPVCGHPRSPTLMEIFPCHSNG